MKLRNNKSGFTLLEIIIVIIIVGVLASLALPKLFQNITFSKSAEAMNMIGAMRRAIQNCSVMTGSWDTTNCRTLASIGYADPYSTTKFDYCATYAAGTDELTIIADQTKTAACAGADTITYVIDMSNDQLDMTRTGAGAFSQL